MGRSVLNSSNVLSMKASRLPILRSFSLRSGSAVTLLGQRNSLPKSACPTGRSTRTYPKPPQIDSRPQIWHGPSLRYSSSVFDEIGIFPRDVACPISLIRSFSDFMRSSFFFPAVEHRLNEAPTARVGLDRDAHCVFQPLRRKFVLGVFQRLGDHRRQRANVGLVKLID